MQPLANKGPSLFDGRGWKAEVLTQAMQDEAFKIRLFRFIDLLPALKNDIQVARLFNEYFGDVEDAPPTVRKHLDAISTQGTPAINAAKEIRAGVESLAQQFIIGQTPQDAVDLPGELRSQGSCRQPRYLRRGSLSEKEANNLLDITLDLLGLSARNCRLYPRSPILDKDDRGSIPRLDISLKISSFIPSLTP